MVQAGVWDVEFGLHPGGPLSPPPQTWCSVLGTRRSAWQGGGMGAESQPGEKGGGWEDREKGQPGEGGRKPKGNADVWHALPRDHRGCW